MADFDELITVTTGIYDLRFRRVPRIVRIGDDDGGDWVFVSIATHDQAEQEDVWLCAGRVKDVDTLDEFAAVYWQNFMLDAERQRRCLKRLIVLVGVPWKVVTLDPMIVGHVQTGAVQVTATPLGDVLAGLPLEDCSDAGAAIRERLVALIRNAQRAAVAGLN